MNSKPLLGIILKLPQTSFSALCSVKKCVLILLTRLGCTSNLPLLADSNDYAVKLSFILPATIPAGKQALPTFIE